MKTRDYSNISGRVRARGRGRSNLRTFERLERRELLAGDLLSFPTPVFPFADAPLSSPDVLWHDLDGDGFVDAIQSQVNSGQVNVTYGAIDQVFAGVQELELDGALSEFAVGDFNGDGFVDIAVLEESREILELLLGANNRNFDTRRTVILDQPAFGITTGDLDNDGISELVFTDLVSFMTSVYRFSAEYDLDVVGSFEGNPDDVQMKDLDGDGTSELIALRAASSRLDIIGDLSSGRFQVLSSYALNANATSVAVADYNQDGLDDLIVGHRRNGRFEPKLRIFDGVGERQFSMNQADIELEIDAINLQLADLNQDEFLDIVVQSYDGRFESLLYLQDPEYPEWGYFAHWQRWGTRFNVESFLLSDVVGTSSIDLLTAHSVGIGVSAGLGDGTFDTGSQIESTLFYDLQDLIAADVTGDGLTDLIAIDDQWNEVFVLKALSDGGYNGPAKIELEFTPRAVNFGNFSGGSTNQIVVLGEDSDNNEQLAVIMLQEEVFNVVQTIDLGAGDELRQGTARLSTADFNNDGLDDLLGHYSTPVFFALGDANFFLTGLDFLSNSSIAEGLTPGDFNGDGFGDIAISNPFASPTSNLLVYLGDGLGNFATPLISGVGATRGSIEAGDFDEDGNLDLVITDTNIRGVGFVKGKGDGTVETPSWLLGEQLHFTITSGDVNVSDFDQDGNLDVLVALRGANIVDLYWGIGNGDFLSPQMYEAQNEITVADTNQDSFPDIVTAGHLRGITILTNDATIVDDKTQIEVVDTITPPVLSELSPVRLKYTIQNTGQEVIDGYRIDSLYLSSNEQVDLSDHRISQFKLNTELRPGELKEYEVLVPAAEFMGIAAGDYQLIYVVNSGARLPRSAAARKSVPISIVRPIAPLTVGDSVEVDLREGQHLYFTAASSLFESVKFKVAGLPEGSRIRLLARARDLPTYERFDKSVTSGNSSEVSLSLATSEASEGFSIAIVVDSLSGSGSQPVRVTLESAEFIVDTKTFGTAGVAGDFTLFVNGTNLQNVSKVELLEGDEVILEATKILQKDQTTLAALLQLEGLSSGLYSVRFLTDDGSSQTIVDSLQVVEKSLTNPIEVDVIVPERVRRSSWYAVKVIWKNVSVNDVEIPLLRAFSSGGLADSREVSESSLNVDFLGINLSAGRPTHLAPGQQQERTFWTYSRQEPGEHTISVSIVSDSELSRIGWDYADALLPPDYSKREDYASTLEELRSTFGDGLQGFKRALLKSLDQQLNYRDASLRELFTHIYHEAWSLSGPSLIGNVVDSFGEGIEVKLQSLSTSELAFETEVTRSGNFFFPDLPPNHDFLLSFKTTSGSIRPRMVTTLGSDPIFVQAEVLPSNAIEGQVTTDTGIAIPSASVSLLTVESADTVEEITSTFGSLLMVDQDGRFEADSLPPGQYIVQVSAPGYIPYKSQILLVDSTKGHKVDNLEVVLSEGLQISGKVRSGQTDKSITATITVFSENMEEALYSSNTDVHGHFKLQVDDDREFALVVSSDGYSTAQLTGLKANEVSDFNIVLQELFEVRGDLVTPSGEVGANVLVALRDSHGNQIGHTVSDAWGRFGFGNVHPGEYFVTVDSGAVSFAQSRPFLAEGGDSIQLESLEVPSSKRVVVTALLSTGEPPSNAMLDVYHHSETLLASIRPNQRGKFEWQSLADGPFILIVRSEQATFPPTPLSLVDVLSAEVTIYAGEWSIKGSVTLDGDFDPGHVIASAIGIDEGNNSISIHRSVNSDGTFEFSGILPGRYSVYANSERFRSSVQEFEVGNSSEDALALHLTALPESELRVVDDNGMPLSEAALYFYSEGTDQLVAAASTSVDGMASLFLGEAEKIDLVIIRDGYQPFIVSGKTVAEIEPQVVLRPTAGNGLVSGTISSLQGKIAAGVAIIALDAHGRLIGASTTREDGTFTLEGIAGLASELRALVGNRPSLKISDSQEGLSGLHLSVEASVLVTDFAYATAESTNRDRAGIPDVVLKYLSTIQRPPVEYIERLNSVFLELAAKFTADLRELSIRQQDVDPYLDLIPKVKQLVVRIKEPPSTPYASLSSISGLPEDLATEARLIEEERIQLEQEFNDHMQHRAQFRGLLNTLDEIDVPGLRYQLSTIIADSVSTVNFLLGLGYAVVGVKVNYFTLLSFAQSIAEAIWLGQSNLSRLQAIAVTTQEAIKVFDDLSERVFQYHDRVDALRKAKTEWLSAVRARAILDYQSPVANVFFTELGGAVNFRLGPVINQQEVPGRLVTVNLPAEASLYDEIFGDVYFADLNEDGQDEIISFYKEGPLAWIGEYYRSPWSTAFIIVGDPDRCDLPTPPDSCRTVDRPVAYDPNDIIGPAGVGALNYIRAESQLEYTIRFENDPEKATAPAAVVTISQTFDEDLDLDSFSFGSIGFDHQVIAIAPTQKRFTQTVDLSQTRGVVLDISGWLDWNTRTVYWVFTSLDPETGELPADPLIGFLPPEDGLGSGQGFVSYTIQSKDGAIAGTRIDSAASIVFDTNEAIATPAIFSTLDAERPESFVTDLPQSSPAHFTVSWEGLDAARDSGILAYNVYVVLNDEPAELWLERTRKTSSTFVGRNRDRLRFYVVAVDAVGRVQQDGVVESSEVLIVAPEWQNPLLHYDVNEDGRVTPLDALQIINHLNRTMRGDLEPERPLGLRGRFFDTNGDGRVSPIDALRVINYLNRRSDAGEGEPYAGASGFCVCQEFSDEVYLLWFDEGDWLNGVVLY